LNFSVLDGWWYEGYRKNAGWALTDEITYQDTNQQDQLDAATIYSMLENEIIPLYFAKNSKGYSPEWIQFIKNSFAYITPNYTMQRMLNDYIDRFYSKEGLRSKALMENNYAKAKEIAAWKEMVASKWDNINVVEMNLSDSYNNSPLCGAASEATIKLDTAGLGKNVGVELVIYKNENGEVKFEETVPFEVVAEEGDVLTFSLKQTIKDAGMFKYAFRVYPNNADLPHRQDFAYMKWI
jgi:starch phosphorylase